MAWEHYRLVFRLESPLHIGYRKTGNLMQTRRYVPGKNLWAALTERIVWLAGQGDSAEAYQEVGRALKEHFRFGYLWPTYSGRMQGWQPHFPWDEDDPAYWDFLYLDGTARTAQRPEVRTADEGSLHEVEFIAPYTRKGEPVYLVGDLWVKDDTPDQVSLNRAAIPLDWQKALQYLRIGGERTYGWGRIRLVELENRRESGEDSGGLQLWGNGWNWSEENGEVVIKGEKDAHLPVHALAAQFNDEPPVSKAEGPIEPLLGWELAENGRYRLPEARIAYEPGAVVSEGFEAVIAPWGYLRGR